jgi:2-isopropylmalate synthase
MAGRASIELKSEELGIAIGNDKEVVGRVVERVKEMESRGFTFEAADASFELLLREEIDGKRATFFKVEKWDTTVSRDASNKVTSTASLVISAGGNQIESQGSGNGPVNAIDTALRRALGDDFAALEGVHLTDYKVRVLDTGQGTGAVTRVLIDSSDGTRTWTTIGVSENIIEASWQALYDSLVFALVRYDLRTEPDGR